MSKVVRAIELGFGTNSVVVDTKHGRPIIRTFPSVVNKKVTGLDDFGAAFSGTKKTVTVDVDGIHYEVGEDATVNSAGDMRVLNDNYVNSTQYKALMLGSLYMIHSDEIDVLALGLPANHWQRRDEAKELAIGEHKYPCGRVIKVKNAIVFPQPVAGLLTYVNSLGQDAYENSFKEQTTVSIDPGYFTFDFALAKGLRIDSTRSGAVNQGVSVILKDIQKELSEAFSLTQFPIDIIDAALWKTPGEIKVHGEKYPFPKCTGKTLSGEDTDVTFDVTKQLEHAPRAAATELRNVIGDGADIDLFIGLGGPISHYLGAIKEAYPRHKFVVLDNPITAVAEGLYYGALQATK